MTNLIKSLYISSYTTALAIVSVHALMMMLDHGIFSFWGGVALAIWPAFGFFAKLFLSPIARTTPNLNHLLAFAVAGLIWSWIQVGPAEQTYFYLYNLALGIAGLLLYIHWYSTLGRTQSEALANGQKPPSFELKNVDGSTWNSSDLEQYPALMLFYRGNWCPLCMAQIKEIAEAYKRLESLGVKVFLVSPQPEKHTQSLSKKFDVNFSFLCDVDGQAARILGIEAKHGTPKGLEALGYESDTVLPTAVAFDNNGAVLWSDQTDNYRVRPEPQTFIDVFQQHGFGKA